MFQQTARYVVQHSGEVTPEERAVIDAVIDYDSIQENYDPFNCDRVKFTYRWDSATSSNLRDYLVVYLRQGMRHPGAYAEALFATGSLYINLDGKIEVYKHTEKAFYEGIPMLWEPKKLQGLHSAIVGAYDTLLNVPVVGTIFLRSGLYVFFLPFISLLLLLKVRSHYTFLVVPFILSLGICLITPVYNARYALPLIYTSPILITLVLCQFKLAFQTKSCDKILRQ